MPTLSAHEALSAIEKGKFEPFYWVCGDEHFFIDRVLAALKKHVVTAAEDFNFDRIDAAKTTAEQVVGTASSHPVMAQYRLVIAKGADAYKAEALGVLNDYAENPLSSTVLVLVASKKPHGSSKLAKTLGKKGAVVECQAVREREVPQWVSRMAQERGMIVEGSAAHVLLEYIGTDLLALDQTVEKAALLAEGKKAFTEQLARDAVAMTRHASVFEVFDAAVEGRARDALAGLHRLYSDGEKAVGLLPGLYWQFRRLWLAAELAAKRLSRDEISRQLGGGRPMPPWILDRLAKQVARFPAPRCREVAPCFYELDRMGKGGSQFPEIHLEHLILQMAQRPARR